MLKNVRFVFVLLLALLFVACNPQPETIVETVVAEIPVDVTRVVEVTREVEVTVVEEIEVTREVEVTRVMEAPAPELTFAQETAVVNIPLTGLIDNRDAEISGMAWYGDNLILMPQYPNYFNEYEGDGVLFALPKDQIMAYLNGESFEPLEPIEIPFTAPTTEEELVPGFQGYEAIAFFGEDLFMTIEAETEEGMTGYLLAGTIAPDLSSIVMDTEIITAINPPAPLDNMSEESLIIALPNVFTIYEANGTVVNEAPEVHLFDGALEEIGTIAFPAIDYRVTDATALDEDGRFWVINYFFPGEEFLLPETDAIADTYSAGPTHSASAGVERLLELQYSENGITLVDAEPIQLQLLADGNLRNWEGIVRLDDAGFLIATDRFPSTLLGFVPLPEPEE